MLERFVTTVKRLVPWYDDAAVAEHERRTEAVRRRSILVRIRAEETLERLAHAYDHGDRGLGRR